VFSVNVADCPPTVFSTLAPVNGLPRLNIVFAHIFKNILLAYVYGVPPAIKFSKNCCTNNAFPAHGAGSNVNGVLTIDSISD
jgi:ABC-type dipeptide/oligopeptide/nickel transport system permease component